MKYLKSIYENLVTEEVVTGLEGISNGDQNIFASIFNNNKLELKEFIQKQLDLENIKFIGNGAIGLAFLWRDKVLKFTTDNKEKEGVETMIKLTPTNGKLPGFAKYYWVKEVTLPEENIKKILWDHPGIEDKIKQTRLDRRIGKKESDDFTLNPEEIQKRKSSERTKKAYIICLEKLDVLNEKDTEISYFIFSLIKRLEKKYLVPGKDNTYKLGKLIDWIKGDEEKYEEKEFIDRGFDKIAIRSTHDLGITRKAFFSDDPETGTNYRKIWNGISKEYFIEFSNKILDIYKYGDQNNIPTSDIHSGNLGYRGSELVAFDCM